MTDVVMRTMSGARSAPRLLSSCFLALASAWAHTEAALLWSECATDNTYVFSHTLYHSCIFLKAPKKNPNKTNAHIVKALSLCKREIEAAEQKQNSSAFSRSESAVEQPAAGSSLPFVHPSSGSRSPKVDFVGILAACSPF